MPEILHPELMRMEKGPHYVLLWMEEVEPRRYARFKLVIPKSHGDQLRVLPEPMTMLYVNKRKHLAIRVETDGNQQYYGPRGPGSGVASEADSSTQDDVDKRSSRKEPTPKHMGKVRTAGTRRPKPNL